MNKKIFEISPEEVKELIIQKSKEHQINKHLLFAIIKKESAFSVLAARYEQSWRWLFDVETFAKLNKISYNTEKSLQSHSWGLMQVMGSVAREHGHRGSLFELLIPDVNIDYGCKHLKKYLDKYATEENAISAYNQGSVKRLVDGRYCNFDYVETVKQFKKEFEVLNDKVDVS